MMEQQLLTVTAAIAVVWIADLLRVCLTRPRTRAAGFVTDEMVSVLVWGAFAASATVAFLAGGHIVHIFLMIVLTRMVYESSHAHLKDNFSFDKPWLIWAPGAKVSLLLAFAVAHVTLAVATAGLAALLVVCLFMATRKDRPVWAATSRILMFPVIPMACLIVAANDPALSWAVLLVLLVVEVFDRVEAVVERMSGKHMPPPWLGLPQSVGGAGTLAALIFAIVLNGAVLGQAWVPLLAATAAVPPAAMAGKFITSSIKHRARIASFPELLKGQGGLLDMLDGWMIAAPVFCLVFAGLS